VGDGCAGPPKPSILSDQSVRLGTVGLTGGFLGTLAGPFGFHLGRANLATEYHLARLCAHATITAALAGARNATRI
jgi:hypothetical protein